jgi:hypothetical protein
MSAPVDVLAVMRGMRDPNNEFHAEAIFVVAELIGHVRAGPCNCVEPTELTSGAVLPAYTCARCETLTRCGGALE